MSDQKLWSSRLFTVVRIQTTDVRQLLLQTQTHFLGESVACTNVCPKSESDCFLHQDKSLWESVCVGAQTFLWRWGCCRCCPMTDVATNCAGVAPVTDSATVYALTTSSLSLSPSPFSPISNLRIFSSSTFSTMKAERSRKYAKESSASFASETWGSRVTN